MYKNKYLIILISSIFLCLFNVVNAKDKDLSLMSKVIYLDPGHGR